MGSAVVPLLADLAAELGLRLEVEPAYGYAARLRLLDGRYRYLRNTIFDPNGAGAVEITTDKDYAAHFLRLSGYPVPVGEAFYSRSWAATLHSDCDPDAAWAYAASVFPYS